MTGFFILLLSYVTLLFSYTANAEESLRFPGDPADNKVVYQLNKADDKYQKAILFSVGEILRHFGDNVEIVVTVIGPGIHTLAKNPKRPVSDEVRQRIKSLSDYGVKFHACGNTMKSMHWTKEDMLPFADVVKIGALDLIKLQQQGFAYISW